MQAANQRVGAFSTGMKQRLRIAFAVIAIGLLSLVTPLVTNVLINSVIPRSELDQLADWHSWRSALTALKERIIAAGSEGAA